MTTQKLTPFLWFEKGGDEAAKYYCTVFKNANIIHSNALATEFEIEGLRLCIISPGPMFRLTEAFSISVPCNTQEEIDYYWNRFVGDGGEESMCGWCKDKYGVSWQIVPAKLGEWMRDPDRAQRVTQAFLKMKKLDMATLEKA
jgi:predicted 3-demethylubiquinone-9 3-methyltransferase (glyoxalase superfamily)